MGTASHVMWSPVLARPAEPRRSVAPLAQMVRDGLRLAAPVAATALAVAALAAPTTSGLDDLSTWVPNASTAAPAGRGAATDGPAGDGRVTVRINPRPQRTANDPSLIAAPPVLAGKAASSKAGTARSLASPKAARPAPQARQSAPAASAPAGAGSSAVTAAPAPAPAPASGPAASAAPAPAPAAEPAKRNSTPGPAAAPAPASGRAKSKSGSQATTESDAQFAAASSGSTSTSPSEERTSDKTEKGNGKAKNGR